MPPPQRTDTVPPNTVASVLHEGRIKSAYQPIVDLDSGAVVAVEALARGPEGPLHMPAALFPAAAREGPPTPRRVAR